MSDLNDFDDAGRDGGDGGAPIALRLLTEGDLPAYKALRDAMLARHEQAFTSDAETERAREAASYRVRLHPQAGGKSLFTLGAYAQARLVGALTCEHENRKKVMHIAHLIGMMVDDDYRGRGIGKRLLQQALVLLRREPRLESVTLSVTAGNQAAIAVYRQAGFTRYGHLPRAIRLSDGRYYAKDLMSLDLRD
ncbi:GNAT family N-acetyltransferase [Roseateles chitinivorans]|uniref:GNAT family N-acetyltransferase n=1 Tax=Roseateles chitinivorans TaxID=2917965 RepID=UPI003D6735F9